LDWTNATTDNPLMNGRDPTSQRVYGPKIMLIDPSYESTKASFSHQKKAGMVGGHA